MDKKYDIAAIGECLIDFVPYKEQKEGKLTFSGCTGGAPPNMLACASQLGLETALISKVGQDVFGNLIKKTLGGCGIDIGAVKTSEEYSTTLAFVSLDETGDRSFSFYRTQTADAMMVEADIDMDVIRNAKVFHFGTVTMPMEPSRSTTLKAVQSAKENGCMISFDPNLREFLWKDLAKAKEEILNAMPLADVVKLSREELTFLTGEENLEKGMNEMMGSYPIQLLVVTLDADGSACMYKNGFAKQGTYVVDVVDTTGAGDAFWGAFLFQLISRQIDVGNPQEQQITDALRFANAAGTLSTTKYGGTASLPTFEEIEACMQNGQLKK